MADEQVTETPKVEETKQEEVVQETKEQSTNKQPDIDKIVQERLARQKLSIMKDLGIENLEDAKSALEEKKKKEEELALERGKFDEVIKKKSQEYSEKLSKLESELKNERIDKQLINSASKNGAINPEQIKELLKNNVQLNAEGRVEILDKDKTPRYNSNGELLSVDEAVQEFLTQNAHFQSATPSGSGSVSNVGKSDTNKTINISELDMNNPADRKLYAEHRKQRDSVSTIINLNK
jgi:hypothetical protein